MKTLVLITEFTIPTLMIKQSPYETMATALGVVGILLVEILIK